jgi:hypothetical protein
MKPEKDQVRIVMVIKITVCVALSYIKESPCFLDVSNAFETPFR